MLDAFVARWGAADPVTPSSVHFVRRDVGYYEWKDFLHLATPGVWADGFLHIATPELPGVNEALRDWSFAIGPHHDARQVFLRNAYGDIVFTQPDGTRPMARVLSPRRARAYDPDLRPELGPTLDFFLLGSTDRIPGRPDEHPFLDRALFDAWVEAHGPLAMNEALVPKLPYGLGGSHTPDNFYVRDLADFYRTTGEVWAAAMPHVAQPTPREAPPEPVVEEAHRLTPWQQWQADHAALLELEPDPRRTHWQWEGHGVEVQGDVLVWFSDTGHGVAQSFADFIAHGPSFPPVPDGVLAELLVRLRRK